jgi:two-component system response regulator AtoC
VPRSLPPVIAVMRGRDPAQAQALLAAGVDDMIAEPVDELAVALVLRHVAGLPRRAPPPAPSALVGDGEAMRELRETIARVAATRSTVLVLGESGTGKELVARAIHDASPRRGRRFVAVNCAAIPGPLLESELFGHVRGAFTDAVRDKPGLFEDADGGSLFLDEIGELPLALQAKLLRVLQDGELRRVGDTGSIQIDVRLIAATLRDLGDEVRAGRFREDLFYRLHVLPVTLPPLRARADDIPQLARFFAARHAARHGLGEVELTAGALDALVRQPWPGNVRELENVIERAVVLADAPPAGQVRRIDADYLASVLHVRGGAPASAEPDAEDDAEPAGDATPALSIKKATRDIEQELIKRALEATSGNRTNAAKLLEISHRALLYKMKEYGIS